MTSFAFKKTIAKTVLSDSKLRDVSTKDDDASLDFIKDVSGNKITGSKKKEEKIELVIPLIKSSHRWTKEPSFKPGDEENEAPESSNKTSAKEAGSAEKDEELTLLDQAAREILEEARRCNDDWEGRAEGGARKRDVPDVMLNLDQEGTTGDDVLDVTHRAEQSSMEDYDNVPIEQFGLACLRGMGWKPGEGIGGYKKAVVAILDPMSRPKGLGLGATRPRAQGEEEVQGKEGEEQLSLKRGAFVLIQGGKQRGLYGEVEGLDADAGRVVLKLAIGGETASVSENVIKLVRPKEFKDRGKVVNNDKYDKFKEKEKLKKEEEEEVKFVSEQKRIKKEKKHKRSRTRSRSPKMKKSKVARTWVRADLRVRCVDKRSEAFKEKLVVVDVATNDTCECTDSRGRRVEGVRTDRLETLIPKAELGRVMVVVGERSGELGEIIHRDKARCQATVQLITSGEVLKLDFDSICEFVGSVPDDE